MSRPEELQPRKSAWGEFARMMKGRMMTFQWSSGERGWQDAFPQAFCASSCCQEQTDGRRNNGARFGQVSAGVEPLGGSDEGGEADWNDGLGEIALPQSGAVEPFGPTTSLFLG